MDLAIIFLIVAAVVIVLWIGYTLNCLGFHDWDKSGTVTDTCRRCGAKRFK